MPTLYILCGPSGAGKTTWAENFIRNQSEDCDIRHVSRDNIRFGLLKDGEDYFSREKTVFRHFIGSICQTLVDGFDVIADATHLNSFSRKKLTNAIDECIKDYEIKYAVFYTAMHDCIKRDASREGRAHVGSDIIQNMFRNFRAPTMEEDSRANEIIEVGDGKEDFSFMIAPYWRNKNELE